MRRTPPPFIVLSGALAVFTLGSGGCGARTTLFDAAEPTLDASIDANESVEVATDSLEPLDAADTIGVPPDLGVDTAPDAGLDDAPDTAPETAVDSGRDSPADVDSTADSGIDSEPETGLDAAEGGSDSASDSGSDAARYMKCGASMCRMDSEDCCPTTQPSGPEQLECHPHGTWCSFSFTCGRAADCAPGQLCCFGAPVMGCASSCGSGGQLCETRAECVNGKPCNPFFGGSSVCGP